MRVTEPVCCLAWVIITPLCSLDRVGTQSRLPDRVTMPWRLVGMGAHSPPISTAGESPEAASRLYQAQRELSRDPTVARERQSQD